VQTFVVTCSATANVLSLAGTRRYVRVSSNVSCTLVHSYDMWPRNVA
jgi:hypothetical protein